MHAVPEDLRPPMPVPVTNVYSRRDGVVPWESCIDVRGAHAENVEVLGSHCGLGHNPLAIAVVADRLAQPAGAWTPYEVPACLRSMVKIGLAPSTDDILVPA